MAVWDQRNVLKDLKYNFMRADDHGKATIKDVDGDFVKLKYEGYGYNVQLPLCRLYDFFGKYSFFNGVHLDNSLYLTARDTDKFEGNVRGKTLRTKKKMYICDSRACARIGGMKLIGKTVSINCWLGHLCTEPVKIQCDTFTASYGKVITKMSDFRKWIGGMNIECKDINIPVSTFGNAGSIAKFFDVKNMNDFFELTDLNPQRLKFEHLFISKHKIF